MKVAQKNYTHDNFSHIIIIRNRAMLGTKMVKERAAALQQRMAELRTESRDRVQRMWSRKTDGLATETEERPQE